jgi:hypothetical protein
VGEVRVGGIDNFRVIFEGGYEEAQERNTDGTGGEVGSLCEIYVDLLELGKTKPSCPYVTLSTVFQFLR